MVIAPLELSCWIIHTIRWYGKEWVTKLDGKSTIVEVITAEVLSCKIEQRPQCKKSLDHVWCWYSFYLSCAFHDLVVFYFGMQLKSKQDILLSYSSVVHSQVQTSFPANIILTIVTGKSVHPYAYLLSLPKFNVTKCIFCLCILLRMAGFNLIWHGRFYSDLTKFYFYY